MANDKGGAMEGVRARLDVIYLSRMAKIIVFFYQVMSEKLDFFTLFASQYRHSWIITNYIG